jgi:uncharacterized protein (TIGR02996 family)
MAELEPFLHAIQADPNGDGPRLVLADWLEEQGASDTAELIRLQCELAHGTDQGLAWRAGKEREQELLQKHATEWLSPLERFQEPATVFCPIAQLQTRLTTFLRHAERIFQVAPLLRDVHCVGYFGEESRSPVEVSPHIPYGVILRLPAQEFPRLPRLLEDLQSLQADLEALSKQPALERLRSLNLNGLLLGAASLTSQPVQALVRAALNFLGLGNGIPRNSWVYSLLHSPYWKNLSVLDLGGNLLDASALFALAEARHLQNLTTLRLQRNGLHGRGVEALVQTGLLGRLETLDLRENSLLAADVATLVDSQQAERLRTLDLSSNPIGLEGLFALIDSPHLEQLSDLRLRHTYLEPPGLAALAESGLLERLQGLSLANSSQGQAALALSASVHTAALRYLDLGSTMAGDAGAIALATSKHLTELETLDLSANLLSDTAAQALANASIFANLTELNLRGNHLTDAGAHALLDSPHLQRLQYLDLTDNRLSPAGIEAVRQRFGATLMATL